MNFSQASCTSADDLYKALDSSPHGLIRENAAKKLAQFGPNAFASTHLSAINILTRQLKSPFVYLLFIAAAIAFLLGEYIDAAFIVVFNLINTSIGFLQEYRSEQTIKLLKKFILSQAKVLRDNQEILLDTSDIVPGDIIILEPGDKLPADVRLIHADGVSVDETTLTGESIPQNKTASTISLAKQIYEAQNIGFAGTTLVSGRALGLVFATADETQLGQIAHLTVQSGRVSTFEKDLSHFSSFILKLVFLTLCILMVANIAIKQDLNQITQLALFAVALAVSVIPEALPVVTTFSLSRGALRMAHKKVVVKRLAAIEDLGSIQVLCTDKTGTITQNKLTVVNQWKQNSKETLLYAHLASAQELTNSFDIAILEALENKNKTLAKNYLHKQEIPFDPKRRRSTVIVHKNKINYLISRGAPEDILNLCKGISDPEKQNIVDWVRNEGKMGKRVLAVASKKLGQRADFRDEKELKLDGFIAFSDPLKSSTIQAVKEAKNLNVQIKILTGDSKEVAINTAQQIGLITDESEAMSADEFNALPLDEKHKAVEKIHVFARVTPQDKYKIIQLLQENHEVGYLGEGINDAPALKIANVGLVVASASDIARDAADIVLLKSSLEVITDGIKEGREVFSNTTKYITATLSSNFGNFYAIAIASLIIDFLPMLPIQILLVNLLSDFPMISISTDNVDHHEIKYPSRPDLRHIAAKATALGVVSTVFDFIFFALYYQISPGVLQTNWFIGSILTELAFLFSVRTNRVFFKSKRPSKTIFVLTAVAAVITIGITYTSLGVRVFKFTPLPIPMLLTTLSVVFMYFITTEVVKLIFVRFGNRSIASTK